jgi:hypothetical protein
MDNLAQSLELAMKEHNDLKTKNDELNAKIKEMEEFIAKKEKEITELKISFANATAKLTKSYQKSVDWIRNNRTRDEYHYKKLYTNLLNNITVEDDKNDDSVKRRRIEMSS